MKLEQKLHEEVLRYKAINNYGKKLFLEQDVPPPPVGDVPPPPPGGDVPPPPPAGGDLTSGLPPAPGADVPPVGTEPTPDNAGTLVAGDSTEELDITDLVNMTKAIKKKVDDNRDEHAGVLTKMNDVFTKLDDLENKLANMDSLFQKIDSLGQKIENMKEPTPVEKLEMRSLDSYPFSQNPQQFFVQKQEQMKSSGKNEYVLTKDEIENYSKDTIRNTFNANENEFGI